jgi:hypothetical protein
VIGEFGPLFTMDTLPLTLPADVGENLAVNDVLWPAPSVKGVVIPLTLKPVPAALACEIVRLAVPEFVKVTVWDPLLPTLTDPKLTLEGLAPSCPWTPVPDKAISAGEPGALLTTEMLPVAAPEDVGAKTAANEALLPALIVIGQLAPLTLNPATEADAWLTVRVALPLFVSVIVWVALLPTDTLP